MSKNYLDWAKNHYENFTVGSFLLPRRLRKPVWLLYAYCRYVDDLGDESLGDRVALLDEWEIDLRRCFQTRPQHPLLQELQKVIVEYSLPQEPFLKLIEANRIDQKVSRYQTFEDLLGYCEYSANPVGHLYLALHGYTDVQRQNLSDYTCTALQLTNFWQDICKDFNKGRIYIPREDLNTYNVKEKDIAAGKLTPNIRQLLRFEIDRTKLYFKRGLPLIKLLKGRTRVSVLLFTAGGQSILDSLERSGYDVFDHSPKLSKGKKMLLLFQAIIRVMCGKEMVWGGHNR